MIGFVRCGTGWFSGLLEVRFKCSEVDLLSSFSLLIAVL